MAKSCCAFGCSNRHKKNCGIGFFRFPRQPVLRKLWILAVRRKNFEPTRASVVCGKHFQTGRPSKDPHHPDYVPNIFIFTHSKKTNRSKSSMKPFNVRTENILKVTPIPGAFNSEKHSTCSSIKTEEHSEVENEMSVQEKTLNQDCTEVCHQMHHEDESHMDIKSEDVSNTEEWSSLQLELQQVYSTLHTVTQNRDQLLKELSEANKAQSIIQNSYASHTEELSGLQLELQQVYSTLHTVTQDRDELLKELSEAKQNQSILQNSLSEKEEKLSTLKKQLQQAYAELNVLRREKEELQNKLSATDATQSILQDPRKLHLYTGLSSPKDFRLILSLLYNVKRCSSERNVVRRISLETQALMVLMKLKLNLWYADLGYRFQCSGSTVQRICVSLIPILEAKLNMLVKSPINTALRKNIPVGFKNTVYENLYQRLQKNIKLRTNQEEESIDANDM